MPPSLSIATAPGSLAGHAVRPATNAGTYYVGAHRAGWLEATTAPLFVSHVTLRARKRLPRRALLADGTPAPWALDSGQFSDVARNGRASVWVAGTAAQRAAAIRDYADAVRRYRDEVGGLVFAAALDVMCEPEMLERTGLTERQAQQLSLDNYLALVEYAPDLPWAAPLQGWTITAHARMVDMYLERGIDLATLPHVTVGSICRRTNVVSAALIIDSLHRRGLHNLHAFGLKAAAFELVADKLASSDSMAWSYAARSRQEACTDDPARRDCRNCLHYALEWRGELVARAGWDAPPAPVAPPRPRPAARPVPARPAATRPPTRTVERTTLARPTTTGERPHDRRGVAGLVGGARRDAPIPRRRMGRADPLDGSGGRGAAAGRRRAPRGRGRGGGRAVPPPRAHRPSAGRFRPGHARAPTRARGPGGSALGATTGRPNETPVSLAPLLSLYQTR